ncbi:JAB domain-containing protein [Saccharicrinis aurantiacus]|uniref:JAB domain-containing protein n=1 Tax=Saccharicrinis aurantiacus TaxID=1849719 RepID=UPI002490B6F7|nr:JAB domain-containing protein [Saccharicrinis aurantiacus]
MSRDYYQLNEVEVVYKPIQGLSNRPVISAPDDAFEIFRRNWDEMNIGYKEEMKMLLLSHSNRILGISNISSGGMSSCIVDPKIVFTTALKCAASSIIMAHNHPSGNLNPSEADKTLQNKLIEGGKLLGISVLDHLIISGIDKKYHSMADGLDI